MKRKKQQAHAGGYIAASVVLAVLLFITPLFSPVLKERISGTAAAGEEPPEPITVLPPGETDSGETIRVLLGDTVEEMTMAEYLTGVLRAEMPASFEQEALCAQAVAARTYTRYRLAAGSTHGDTADICGDHTCCQAFSTREAAAAAWGSKVEYYEAKVENAVAATDGQTIFYDGQPILAVFHSSSDGQTKSAGTVWTQDLPYLCSVTSPEGNGVPNYYSRAEFSTEAFKTRFLAAYPEADLSGDPADWITDLVRTEGSNVEKLTVGGVTVRGSRMRTIFDLRSASFDVEADKNGVTFFVTGYGHGVGMSQYGANAMAAAGSTWQEIITHYYTGVTVSRWTGTP